MPGRKLIVEIIGDTAGLDRGLARARGSVNRFDRQTGKAVRGVASASGAFRSLGRSVAFASGGFLAFASATEAVKASVEAATQAAVTQRQLRTQFKASGQSLTQYRAEIEETSTELSKLAGFTRDELTRAFITGFRATQSVSKGLEIERVAADAARGTHRDLSTVTLALTKAVVGSAGSLKRLGIVLPPSVKGMAALELVSKRFAGQAKAGTTAQERLGAAIHNTEEVIGTALVPTINKVANRLADWLGKTENQKRLQRDVSQVVRDGTKIVTGLAEAVKILTSLLRPLVAALGGAHDAARTLGIMFLLLKARGYAAAAGIKFAGEAAVVTEGEMAGAGAAAATAGAEMNAAGASAVVAGGEMKAAGAAATVATAEMSAGAAATAGNMAKAAGAAGALFRAVRPLATIGAIIISIDLITKSKEIIEDKGKSLGQKLGGLIEQGFTPLGVQHKVVEAVAGKRVADLIERGTEDALTLGAAEGVRAIANYIEGHPFHAKILFDLGRADFQPGRAPGGPGAFPEGEVTTPAGLGKLGLRAQFAKLEVALAEAQVTTTLRDDKRILLLERKNIQDQLKTRKLTFKERNDLKTQLANINGQIVQVDQQIAQQQQQAADKRKQAAQDAAAARIAALQFAVEKAGGTATLKDDLRALNNLQAEIKRQIKVSGRTLELAQQLFQVQQQIADVRKQIAANRAAAAQRRQFRSLGFGPTGEDLAPGLRTLRAQAARVRDALKGTFLDTKHNENLLKQIRKILSGGLGAVGADVRRKIGEILKGLDDQLKQHAVDVTKFRKTSGDAIIAALGLNLTPQQRRELNEIFAATGPGMTLPTPSGQYGGAGATGGIVVNGDVHIHDASDPKKIEQHLTKRAKQRPHVRRGAR